MRKRQKLEIDPDLIRKPEPKAVKPKAKAVKPKPKPKLRMSPAAIQRVEEYIEAAHGTEDEQFASDLSTLLKFYWEAVG